MVTTPSQRRGRTKRPCPPLRRRTLSPGWSYPVFGWGYPVFGWGYPVFGWGYPVFGWSYTEVG